MVCTPELHTLIEKDHLGDCPEKDCCLWLRFRKPVQKPSSESIDHFRITFGLFFKASLGAHPSIWKLVLIHMQMKTNFDMKRWAPGLALKKRPKVIRKWPIDITWLWRWLPYRLLKHQSQTTVLLRTPISQLIFLNQGKWPKYWSIIITITCSQIY